MSPAMPSGLRLRFEPELERQFHASVAPARLRHFTISGLIALVIYNGFLLADWLMVPDAFYIAALLRLGVITPMGIVVLLAIGRYQDFCLRQPIWFVETIVLMTGVCAAGTLAVVLASTRSPMAYIYHGGFVPVIIYGTIVQRMRFRYALLYAHLILLIHIVGVMMTPDFPFALKWPMMLMAISVAAYTLVANHRMEYDERQRFLLGLAEQSLVQQLSQTHAQLEALSRSDGLTGVANRRHFDEYLQQQWNALKTEGGDLSLLLLDVDHFKAFNDRYGHPAGDECLRCVARELSRLVPPPDGLVSRWGGEEFVAVLPHTGEATAVDLAQRIRQSVQALGLRHESSPTAQSVTVSIGVATVTPQQSANPPDDLLARADTALYEAKHSGRNCVRTLGSINSKASA